MPSFLDFGEDEDEVELKFDGCSECANVKRPRTCRQCDSGEFFEDREPDGLDTIFR